MMKEKLLCKEKGLTVYKLCLMALMTALLCVLAPMAVYVGPVPITLATLAIYFIVYLIGTWAGAGSVCLYILLGAVGVPVFSGFSGGVGKLAGPTGGYLIGYIFMAVIGGVVIEMTKRNIWWTMLGWVAGTVVLYIFGTLWYILVMSLHENFISLSAVLGACVFPFIPGDIAKILVATFLGQEVRKNLVKAHLLN